MTLKRFTLIFALLALLAAGVKAHDDSDRLHFSRVSIRQGAFAFSLDNSTLLEATGLDAEALRAALMDGATLADLVEANEANEADVAAVMADMQAGATEAINENAASFLGGLEDHIGEAMNASHARRGFWGWRGLRLPRIFAYAGVGEAIMAATDLDASELRSALAAGSTIAELIEANDGDVADVSASIAATITDAVNDAAAERIASLEQDINTAFNSDYAEKWRRWRRLPKPRGLFGSWDAHGAADDASAETAEA